MVHGSSFTTRWVHFGTRKYWNVGSPKWMKSWQQNPIGYDNIWFIKSMLQCRFSCSGLKMLLQKNTGNCRYTRIEPDKQLPSEQVLIGRGQKCDWSAKSSRWHLLNWTFSIDFSNIMSDNHCSRSGWRQLLPEARSPKHLLNWRLLQKIWFIAWQIWLPTSVWNFRSIYQMLRLNPQPRVRLIRTALSISWTHRFMVTLDMSRSSSRWNSPSTGSCLKLGGRQLAFRRFGTPSNNV